MTQTRGPHFLHAQTIALQTYAHKRTVSNIGVGAHYQIAFTNRALQAIRAETAAYVSIVSE